MALLTRIPTHESIRCFRRSAQARYAEACRLAAADDRLPSIYLLGYTAEMLLKAAFFRVQGLYVTDPIRLAELKFAQTAAARWGLSAPRNFHDLTWWASLLVESRNAAGRPYSYQFSRNLAANVDRIYRNWREFIRYHTNRPYRGEVNAVRAATGWLLGQYRFLY